MLHEIVNGGREETEARGEAYGEVSPGAGETRVKLVVTFNDPGVTLSLALILMFRLIYGFRTFQMPLDGGLDTAMKKA